MRRYNEAMKGTKIILITGIIIAFILLIGVVTADNLEIIPITNESLPLEPTILISETERFHQEKPSMTFGGSYFYVAYQSYEEKENLDIFVKKYDLDWECVEKKRITNDTSGQYSPSIVANNSKNLYLAYHSDETGKDEITIQKYDFNLTPVGEPKPIVNETFDLSEPSIITTNNYIYIAFVLFENKTRDIVVEKYDFNWNFIDRERTKYSSPHPIEFDLPSMAFANDNISLAYCSKREGNYYIFVEKYDLNLTQIKKQKEIAIVMYDQPDPSIIVVDNNLYIAYRSVEKGNRDIFVEKYNLDLTYLNRVRITTNEDVQREPSILFVENNSYMVYTTEENVNLGSCIYVRKFDPNTEETFKQEGPSLIFKDNHFYIAYHSNEKGNWDVWVKKYDFNWKFIEKKRITTNKNLSQKFPAITFTDDSFFIAYSGKKEKEKENCDIFVEKYDLDFNRIKSKQITTDSSAQTDPSIISTENCLYLAYESNETGNADIFVEKYDLNLNPVVKKRITTDKYNQSNPSITFIKNNISVFYESEGDIFIKDYDLDLTSVEVEQKITDDDAKKEPTVIFANSSLYVAYQSKPDDKWCIFVDKYDSDLNHIEQKKIENKTISFDDSYPSITDANGSLYLAFAVDKMLYRVNVSNIPPVRPPPPPSLIYSIIAGLIIFSVLIAYVKRDEFMTSKRYRYFVLVATSIILFLFAYSLKYPDVKEVNIFIGSLLITYPLLIGTISKNARESFTFASVAFLCSLFGLLFYGGFSDYEIPSILFVYLGVFGVYFALVVCSVAAQPLMSLLKDEIKRRITKFKPIPNTYIAGKPIREKEMFFGRQDVFDDLKQKFITEKEAAIVLFGERRIGKTSALYQIKNGELGDKFIPLFIDMQDVGDMDTYRFFGFISQKISQVLKEKDIDMDEYVFDKNIDSYTTTFNKFSKDASNLIGDQQLLLMFDETEKFKKMIKEKKFDSGIYDYFEKLIQHVPKLSFIFTGSSRFIRMKDKPLFRAADYQQITFLKRKDAIKLIKKPVKGFVQYSDRIINRILRITGYHPFYIQYTCHAIVDNLNRNKRNKVTMKDIDFVISEFQKNVPMHLSYVWTEISYDEKVVLSLMSEIINNVDKFVTASEIERDMHKKEEEESITINIGKKIEKVLGDLLEKGILEKKKKGYRFKVDLIRHWVKEYHEIWRVVKEEKDEYVSE